MSETLLVIFGGATGAAIVNLLSNLITKLLEKSGKRKDKHTEALESVERRLETVESGSMAMLLDRIQYLCKVYISDGEVDPDDLRRLHIMHNSYHALGGNGDLDKLLARVESLPFKK